MIITFKNLLITVLISLLLLTIVNAQWLDKGDYKEIQVSNRSITQIIANPADTFFIVVDDSNTIYKYDFGGNLLSKKNNFVPNPLLSYYRMKVNNDGKTYIVGKFQMSLQDVKLFIKVYDINTDSLILDKSFPLGSFSGGEYASINYLFDEYDYERKQFIYSFNFYLSRSSKGGDAGYTKNGGTLSIYHGNLDSTISYAYLGAQLINIAHDLNFFTIVSNITNYTFRPSTGVKNGSSDDTFTFFNLKKRKSVILARNYEHYSPDNNFQFGLFPKICRFANQDSSFIAITDSILNFFTYSSDTAYLLNSLITKKPVVDAIFSQDDKYLVTSNPTNEINIYFLAQKSPLKTYVLLDKVQSNILTWINDKQGFLAGNSKGKVKLFQPDIFSDSLIARFTTNKKIVQQNKNVEFFNISAGSPGSFLWDFGDSTFSTDENPSHAYKNTGKYTIKFYAFKGSNSDSIISDDYITVYPSIMADFYSDNQIGDVTLTVKFQDISSGPVSKWRWNFGDGDTSSIQNPNHTYSNSGIYPVRLIISDGIFYDTLLKNDYISVNQKPISDTIFAKEKIIWSYDKNFEPLTGFESVKGGYFVEALKDDKSTFFRLDTNLDTLWTKTLYKSSLHRPMQQTPNGTLYCEGNQVPDTMSFLLNRLDESGNFSTANNFKLNRSDLAFEYHANNNGYIVLTNSVPSDKFLLVQKFDNEDTLIPRNCYIPSWDKISYIKSLKFLDFMPDYLRIFTFELYSPREDYPGKWYLRIRKLYLSSNYESSSIMELASIVGIDALEKLDSSTFVWINRGETINLYNDKDVTNINTVFPKTSLKSICPITDTSFIVCGSKEGYCWFALLDKSLRILDEHKIVERIGSFNSVSRNMDGTLFFTGSLYKNSFTGITNDKIGSDMMQATATNNGLLLMKTKNLGYSSVIEKTNNDNALTISPNPASDFIEISYPPLERGSGGVALKIYNILGEIQTTTPNLTPALSTSGEGARIDVSALAPGMYFVRVGDKVSKFIKIGN